MNVANMLLCYIQGVSDAFQGVAAPLTLVLMVDVLTTAIYLGVKAFNGPWIASLIFLIIAVFIMILWSSCAVCYNLCKAKMCKTKCKRVLVKSSLGLEGVCTS